MSRIHEMVDAAPNEDQNASIGLKEYQMTAIRLTTKAVGLVDALGEKSRPQGFFAVMSPSELRTE
jgi:hypothetical protein